MGGVDKGLVTLGGRPIVAHVLARLAPQVDEILVNANRNLDTYSAFGCRVFPDLNPGYAGPLEGLRSALAAARHAWVVTVPCDSPGLPLDLVDRLWRARVRAGSDIAVARTGTQVHPVFCLCPTSLADNLAAFLGTGERKFLAWTAHLHCVEVAFDDVPEAFENINTREDLARRAGPPR